MPIIVDTIPFCHSDGYVGIVIGLFQYLPWFITFAPFVWGWKRREMLYVMYIYFIRILTLSTWFLQILFEDPLQRPECIFDPFDLFPRYGLPCSEAVQACATLGFMVFYKLIYKKHFYCANAVTALVLIMVPIAMTTVGSYYTHQIILGCLYGFFASFCYIIFLRFVFSIYLDDYIKMKKKHYRKRKKYQSTRSGTIVEFFLGDYTKKL